MSDKAHKLRPCLRSSAPLANLPIPTSSPTSTTPSSSNNMTKATTYTARTRTASKKKNDSALDELQKQVELEKKKRELKKKQRAKEKGADKEKKKKTDQEKAVTVLPPNNNKVIAIGSEDEEETESSYTPAANDDWTDAKDTEALARHGISPNHLFGKGHEELTKAKGTALTEQGTKETISDEHMTVNFTAAENSPNKKKSKRTDIPPSGMTTPSPKRQITGTMCLNQRLSRTRWCTLR